MNDRHPTELLSAYLDGEVTDEERVEVARHLDACVSCRALLDDFRTLASAAAQEPPPDVPAGMAARIRAALASRTADLPVREPRRDFLGWLPLPLAVAAALVVVATGGWILLRRQPDRRPVEVAQATRSSAPPASAPESERSDRPVAAPPPVAPERLPDKDAAARLQSLGYAGHAERDRRESPGDLQKPAAPASPAPAPPASAPPTSSPGLLAPTKSNEEAGSEPAEDAGKVAFRAAARPEAGRRSILFEIEGARGTLTESGLVTLVLDRGACSVDLTDARPAGEEVRFIFHLASAAPESRPVGAADESKVAAARPPAGAVAEARPGAEAAAPAGGFAEVQQGADRGRRSITLVRGTPSASRPIEVANVDEVERRLRRLLDVTARDLLASRCGVPIPRVPPDR